jgi:hypothetical protein
MSICQSHGVQPPNGNHEMLGHDAPIARYFPHEGMRKVSPRVGKNALKTDCFAYVRLSTPHRVTPGISITNDLEILSCLSRAYQPNKESR